MIVQIPRAAGVIKVRVLTYETDFTHASGLSPKTLEVPEDTLLMVWSAEGQEPVALLPGEDVWKPYDPEDRHNIEELRKPEPCDEDWGVCDEELDEDLDEDE